MLVDNQGLPHAIAVTSANVTDREDTLAAIEQNAEYLSAVNIVLTDGGYSGQTFANYVSGLINAQVHVAKSSELHTFSVIPKRWVVERSFAWLEKPQTLEKYRTITQH
jgi:transposase